VWLDRVFPAIATSWLMQIEQDASIAHHLSRWFQGNVSNVPQENIRLEISGDVKRATDRTFRTAHRQDAITVHLNRALNRLYARSVRLVKDIQKQVLSYVWTVDLDPCHSTRPAYSAL
jgi:hypothetical protein